MPTAGLLRPKPGWLRPEDACQVLEAALPLRLEAAPAWAGARPAAWDRSAAELRRDHGGGGGDLGVGGGPPGGAGILPPPPDGRWVRQGSVNDGDRLVARQPGRRGPRRPEGWPARAPARRSRRCWSGGWAQGRWWWPPCRAPSSPSSRRRSRGAGRHRHPRAAHLRGDALHDRGGRHRAPEGRGRALGRRLSPGGPPQRHREAHPAGPGAGLPARRRGGGQPLEGAGEWGKAAAAAVLGEPRRALPPSQQGIAAGEPGREAVGRPGHHVHGASAGRPTTTEGGREAARQHGREERAAPRARPAGRKETAGRGAGWAATRCGTSGRSRS